ncbi:MAG: hypothetical protein RLZZ361_877 [Cyanobacteriota bacterium]|jgi:histidine triad (HIT) family protein
MLIESCIFCNIIAGFIPSKKVFETDLVFAFRDINPCAPHHILVIPKVHIQDLNFLEDRELSAELLTVIPKIALQEGFSSYRTVANTGAESGQTVFHLHLHIIAGRKQNWPPG